MTTDTAAPPFSQRLALVFTATAQRPVMQAFDQILAEIDASLAPGLEHSVAHGRLAWWREEVGRLMAGQPLHPAAKTLHAAAPTADFSRLGNVLSAAEYQLAGHAPRDPTELRVQIERVHVAPETLRAELLHGGPEPRLVPFARALGEAIGYASCLETAEPGQTSVYRGKVLEALRGVTLDADLASAGRHGFVRAALIAARLTPRGISSPPGVLRSLFIGWRAARRLRLELA